jgi:hypothetical protein
MRLKLRSCRVIVAPDIFIRSLSLRGVECVVSVAETRTAGTGRYFRDRYDDVSNAKIPVVEISIFAGANLIKLLQNGTEVVAWISDSDVNDWQLFLESTSAVIALLVVGVPAILNVGVASFKLFFHVRLHRCAPIVPLILFCVEIVENLMRIWFGIVNSFFRWGFLYVFTTVCSSSSWACSIISSLLIGLKWLEVTKRVTSKSRFLTRFRYVFLIASLFVFSLEVISSLLRGLRFPIPLLAGISWSLLVAISFAVIVLLWVSGYRILKHLGPASSANRPARRQTIALIISAIPLALVGLCYIAFVSVPVLGVLGPGFSVAYIAVTLTSLNLVSTIQLLAFRSEDEALLDPETARSDRGATTDATRLPSRRNSSTK